MSDEKDGDYVVGHGRPPQATRFKPGQSGNPSGRPKGAKNLATMLTKIINERVSITENGKRKTISKLEATVKQLVNKAASGDHKSIQPLLQLVQLIEGRTEAPSESNVPIREADQTVMQGILTRLRREVTPETPNEKETDNVDDYYTI